MPGGGPQQVVVAVDPGREKCGLAAVSREGVLDRAIVQTADVARAVAGLASRRGAAVIVVGSRTGSGQVLAALEQAGLSLPVVTVEEHMTTLNARRRYWRENPPGCLGRLVPEGMRLPPRPIDDYAAVLLAERYLAGAADLKISPPHDNGGRTTRRPHDNGGRGR